MRFNQTRLSLVPVKGKVSDSRGGVLPGVSILAKGSQQTRLKKLLHVTKNYSMYQMKNVNPCVTKFAMSMRTQIFK